MPYENFCKAGSNNLFPLSRDNVMKALTIPLTQKLTLILLSILTVNPAMAKSDKQIMDDVQRAREMSRQHKNHSKHVKPIEFAHKYRGVFYGYLPCKDCDGIKTTLSLKNKNNYLLVTQPARDPSREYFDKGKYTWNDKTQTVTLVSRKNSGIRKFRIKNESALIQLNSDGTLINKNQDEYTLLRSDKNKSRQVHIH